jgi:hypothetical protein
MLNSRFRLPTLTFVLALFALSSSCWFRKEPKTFTPPPPQTQSPLPSEATPITAEPPKISGDPTAAIPAAPTTIPEVAAPPAPKPTAPRRNPVAITPPKPATAAPPSEQPPPPRLGPLFTADEQRQYNRNIEDSLNRVRRALELLSRKNLNADQQVEITRIVTFQKQAEQAREAQDLLTAKSLAERADTLATDLLGRIP